MTQIQVNKDKQLNEADFSEDEENIDSDRLEPDSPEMKQLTL
jgi:hypothetical protein